MELLTTKLNNMKKLITILCILMCSCASQRLTVEEEPYRIEYNYDIETGETYIIEYYYDPSKND